MKPTNQKQNRSLVRRLDQEVEKVVYKVMTNQGLEQTVSSAVKKALVDLVKRYFLLIFIGIIFLIFAHALAFSIALKLTINSIAVSS